MDIKLETLDGRHALHGVFSHRVKFLGSDNAASFVSVRTWLWENYGPGLERELVWLMHYPETGIQQVQWAWHNDDRKHYLYLNDSLVTHFSLKYCNT